MTVTVKDRRPIRLSNLRAIRMLIPESLDKLFDEKRFARKFFRRLLSEMDESGVEAYRPGPWHAGLEPFPD